MHLPQTFNPWVARLEAASNISIGKWTDFLDALRQRHDFFHQMGGRLSDHYDPRSRTLTLSPDVGNSNSLAALGVAAHESGHALQQADAYLPLRARTALAPVASFGSNLGFFLFFIGFIFVRNPLLMNAGIVLFSTAVLFTLITLPVEIDASRRALRQLSDHAILVAGELDGARAVLRAAALTYVAAALMAILQLVRLLLIRRSR